MEIILTRNQLSLDAISRDIDIKDIKPHHFIYRCYILFKECNKVTFKDDDGTETILKNRH